MIRCLLWGLLCMIFHVSILAKTETTNEAKRSVEIEFRIFGNDALLTYDNEWKSKARISYVEKKKIVAYRDEKTGQCLLEKIRSQDKLRRIKRYDDEENFSKLFYIYSRSLEKNELEKIAGKKITLFCKGYQVHLLKDHADDNSGTTRNNLRRRKRENGQRSDVQESHQEISKKLLDDLISAEYLAANSFHDGKGTKRNANGGQGSGEIQYPSAFSKLAQPAGVDYHALIRNNVHPEAHSVHPIDITSSVTITTGSSDSAWSYSPSASSHYGHGVQHHNTSSHKQLPSGGVSVSNRYNASREELPRGGIHHPHHHPNSEHQPPLGQHPSSSGHSLNNEEYQPTASGGTRHHHGHASHPPHGHTHQTSHHHIPHHKLHHQHEHHQHQHHQNQHHQHHTHQHHHHQHHTHQHHQHHHKPHESRTHQLPHHPAANDSQPLHTSHHGSLFPGGESSMYAPRYPPSSTSKVYHSQGPSHGGQSGPREVTEAYYPPSSTSKHHPHGVSSTASPLDQSRKPAPQYPPSSSSKLHPLVDNSRNSGHHTLIGQPEPLPSQFPPSSTSKIHYSSGSRTHGKLPGHSFVTESPSTHVTSHEIGSYPPSSSSKINSGRTPLAGSLPDTSYYPPSSTSKVHFPSSSGGHDVPPVGHSAHANSNFHSHSPYPPSSSSGQQYISPHHSDQLSTTSAYSSEHHPLTHFPTSSPRTDYSSSAFIHHGGPAGQVPQLAGNQPNYYPPSSMSKVHHQSLPAHGVIPVHNLHTQQYSPSSSGKEIPHHSSVQEKHHQQISHQTPSNYPPSSSSKLDHVSRNSSIQPPSNGATAAGYYPSSSRVQITPQSSNARSEHQLGQITATTKVTITHGPSYHAPSTLHKPAYAQNKPHPGPDHSETPTRHSAQEPLYFGPSSSSHLGNNGSYGQSILSRGIPPSSSTYGLFTPSQYPPSSSSKIQPFYTTNLSDIGHGGAYYDPYYTSKNTQPAVQGSSSAGSSYHPTGHYHYNSSNTGRFPSSAAQSAAAHPSQGAYIHETEAHGGNEQSTQYPPSSSSHYYPKNGDQLSQGFPSTRNLQSRPCASSPRSLYSITTRTILTPHGISQKPVSFMKNGDSNCGDGQTTSAAVYSGRYAPCATSVGVGQGKTIQTPCAVHPYNGSTRKTQRSIVPGPAFIPTKKTLQDENAKAEEKIETSQVPSQINIEYPNSESVIVTNVGESPAEVFDSVDYPISNSKLHYTKLEKIVSKEKNSLPENPISEGDSSEREFQEEIARLEKDVEIFEGADDYNKSAKPMKYQNLNSDGKQASNQDSKEEAIEEEVKEGDVLEPGDRILGKDGYTISDGFRGRVLSVTGQIGKTRATENRSKPSDAKMNPVQFRYSSELGKYVKENGVQKDRSDCQGELLFTCTEFLGSNGRAKICKPKPRTKSDGTPC